LSDKVRVTPLAQRASWCRKATVYDEEIALAFVRAFYKLQTPARLVELSTIGRGLADIRARGIDAHLRDLERDMRPRRRRHVR
jgi:hypothetical protein